MVLPPMLVFKILRVPGETPLTRPARETSTARESEKLRPEKEKVHLTLARKGHFVVFVEKFPCHTARAAKGETAKLRRKIIFSLLVCPFSNLISGLE